MVITIKVKTGEKDKVFGSVSTKQIVSELKKKNIDVEKTKIKMDNPLSSLGIHLVIIELHKKVKANLKVEIVKG